MSTCALMARDGQIAAISPLRAYRWSSPARRSIRRRYACSRGRFAGQQCCSVTAPIDLLDRCTRRSLLQRQHSIDLDVLFEHRISEGVVSRGWFEDDFPLDERCHVRAELALFLTDALRDKF